jgi:hypothetical protein
MARNAAPLASFITDNSRDLVSRSTGCFYYHPVGGLNLNTICKK